MFKSSVISNFTKYSAAYAAIFLLSAATLAWEIILTRVFAITQFYHFAFLAVNVALLGFGASGTALSLRPRWTDPDADGRPEERPALLRRLEWNILAFVGTLVGSYLLVNALPFDSYAIAWDSRQVWLLVIYYLALSTPFFFTGMAVGMALAMTRQRSNRVYASNLLGSALGALAAPFILPWLGLPGVIFALAAVGVLAALATRRPNVGATGWRATGWSPLPRLLALSLLTLLLLLAAFFPPAWADLRISPYKGLPQALNYPGSQVIARQDGAIARVEIIESGGVRSLPGLSFQYRGQLPPQYGLLSDSDDLNPVLDNAQAIDWTFLDYLPEALAYDLTGADPVLVLHPRGGLAIWQALNGGASARPIIAIEPDPLAVTQIDQILSADSPYRQPQVTTITESARSFLQRDQEKYGVIHLALTQPYRPVTSGAFSLSENYDLTLEALDAYLDHLSPAGILALSRWLQIPPSESVRTLALLAEGLRRHGVEQPGEHIVALRGVQTTTFYVKLTPWSSTELAQVRDFARSRRFDISFAPDLQADETNQYNILPEPYYEQAYLDLLITPSVNSFPAGWPAPSSASNRLPSAGL
ncbi:MAG TPA: hypothetical protein G4N94_00300 [Caldilineae bacterium]|nr:hypothetical protein [Caldilineae bacterium]